MRARPRPRAVLALAFGVLALASCSSDDDDTSPSAPPASGGATTGVPGSSAVSTDASTSAVATTEPGTVAPVPETGVPGLDSTDVVCRSWSRFAGSFQAVAVAASFSDPATAAQLEVLAAPTVTDAYDQLVTAWPDDLAAERDTVATGYLGPFATRASAAVTALTEAGATPADLDAIREAWEAALAKRDPTTPELSVSVSEELGTLVDTAASSFAADVPPIPQDESLQVTAEVPQTEAYLAANCPDRGTLSGDVD